MKLLYAFVGKVGTLKEAINRPAIIALGEYQKELVRQTKVQYGKVVDLNDVEPKHDEA